MLPSTNITFTAYIFQEDYHRLTTREVTHASQQQKGGSLFGQWTSTGNPVIHHAMSTFNRSQGDTMAKSLYESFRVCRIGEWRPVLAHTYDMQAKEERERLIRGREPSTRFLVLDVSSTEIVPYLLNRQTAGQHERGMLERLTGENPFNKTESFEQPMPRRDYDYAAVRYPARQPNLPPQVPGAAHFQVAITADVQWYSGEDGTKKLQKVVEDFNEIAVGNVNMSRDAKTQDISLSFMDKHRRKKWEIKFPPGFPSVGALLIENPGTRQEYHQRQGSSDKASKAVKNMISSIQKSSVY